MNQKNTRRWMIGTAAGFFLLWVIISVLDVLLHENLTFLFVFWVSGILVLVITLALQNKHPSLRSGVKGLALGMAVFALVSAAMYFFVDPQLYKLNNPYFRIVDQNDTLDSASGNYIFNVTIRNDGADGRATVSCEVQKADLTTKTKFLTISLKRNEETTLHFFFSIYGDLGGQLVETYRFSFEPYAEEK